MISPIQVVDSSIYTVVLDEEDLNPDKTTGNPHMCHMKRMLMREASVTKRLQCKRHFFNTEPIIDDNHVPARKRNASALKRSFDGEGKEIKKKIRNTSGIFARKPNKKPRAAAKSTGT